MTKPIRRTKTGASAMAALLLAAATLTGTAHAAQDTPVAGASESGTSDAAPGHPATLSALQAAVQAGVPGAVAEARDRNGTWRTAVGVGNRQTGQARSLNDRFRIGGLTNTFVATVLLQMEAEGRLSLDDTVQRHLPGVVTGGGNDGSRITVRQLLNHTTGLYDYLADPTYYETYTLGDGFLQHRYDTLTPQQRLQVAFAHPPSFPAGSRHSFSHTNDLLAALVVEAVGSTYEEEVRRRVIAPLGLTSTSHPGTGTTLPKPSSRHYSKLFYGTQPDRIDDVTALNGSQNWGDGDMISSAADLNRFYGALMGGKLLPAQQLTELKATVVNPDFPSSSYGLGVERLTMSCGTDIWYHDGGVVGSLTVSAFTEDGRRTLTFNYNGDWEFSQLLATMSAEFCPASTTH
ncbi:serine hydrolase domain-containing protein [Streptomyces mesophilus]|uniref:serine hydrolase domain-containing protein n=1 Tax=Streptomyces mesophilus TaxID=1775132 RepID=UPI00331E96F0